MCRAGHFCTALLHLEPDAQARLLTNYCINGITGHRVGCHLDREQGSWSLPEMCVPVDRRTSAATQCDGISNATFSLI
jgi:hypothetical protein